MYSVLYNDQRETVSIAFPSVNPKVDLQTKDQVLSRLQAMYHYEKETALAKYRYSFHPLDCSKSAHGSYGIVISFLDPKSNLRLLNETLPFKYTDLSVSCDTTKTKLVYNVGPTDGFYFAPIMKAIIQLTGSGRCLYSFEKIIPKIVGYDKFWLPENEQQQ